jgi:DNA-binding protein
VNRRNELEGVPLLITKIEEWSKLRGIDKLPYQEQRYKIMEEFGELFGAYYRGNTLELKDSLGDIVVTLIIYVQQFSNGECNFFEEFWWVDTDEFKGLAYHLDQIATSTTLIYAGASGIWVLRYVIADLKHIAKHYGWNLTECVEHAWEEIKDRKGQVVDGKWVKEKDLLNLG